MSSQTYLDAAERRTDRTPQERVDLAAARGFGPGSHRDESAVLRLDGVAARTHP